jgi:multicomponent K+:H+ antiporter subunit E
MAARLVPHPILTVVITGVWTALVNHLSLGHLIMGLMLGLVIPWFTSAYWPDRPVIRRPMRMLEYALVVLWDIIVSNVQVAYWVLFRRGASLRSQFVTVPIDLETPEAITVLAGTITMTPGTVSADLAADGSAILVHCLETLDPEATARQIKSRYERRLKEIFEWSRPPA